MLKIIITTKFIWQIDIHPTYIAPHPSIATPESGHCIFHYQIAIEL